MFAHWIALETSVHLNCTAILWGLLLSPNPYVYLFIFEEGRLHVSLLLKPTKQQGRKTNSPSFYQPSNQNARCRTVQMFINLTVFFFWGCPFLRLGVTMETVNMGEGLN